MNGELTIGKVAAEAGVNIQTLRYYERRRLLIAAARRESGYRLYNSDAVIRVRFIKNAQSLGFTLNEIATLLRLRVKHRSQCPDVKAKARKKLDSVHQKIEGLKVLEKSLKTLIRACDAQSTTDSCSLLEALEKNGRTKISKRSV